MNKISERERTLAALSARHHFINQTCRCKCANGESSTVKHPSPPIVGRALNQSPYRRVYWAATIVNIDYRQVANYDLQIEKADYKWVWHFVATRILNSIPNPTEDGVPYGVRRHLFSSRPKVEEKLFAIWYRQSELWTPRRREQGMKWGHLFIPEVKDPVRWKNG
jgi:hypothetical protein